ncbi:hypothetical protein SAMN05421505_13831 [Sinosporangium album]|uniref:TIGR01777 family protein n=1 Tax=Sinosporangium album TaxID=504805 RepID=A0A1G8IPG9_9ACTN|nr:TIGR01777 family oxidoreductase [Sinosporangium album]SDI20742.1 hypothetical protein SAMN05421505_13831 [Sinosporangium album]
MTVIVTGSSGLLGSALIRSLRGDGQTVITLVRRPPRGAGESFWNPEKGLLDTDVLQEADAVVHLAGAGIGGKRWTPDRKRLILRSRVDGTRTIARALAHMRHKPRVFLSASAVGYYGDTRDRVVDESSPPGTGFLADVVRAWESETEPAEDAGIRTVRLRTGMVLSGKGGALGPILPIFRLGLGAPLGSGRQFWPWIAIDDWVGAVRHMLDDPEARGPVNLTAPNPVTNAEFTRTLGKVLGKPTLPLAVPGFALRLGLGEFASEGVLIGPRAVPKRLLAMNYTFRYTDLRRALAAVL